MCYKQAELDGTSHRLTTKLKAVIWFVYANVGFNRTVSVCCLCLETEARLLSVAKPSREPQNHVNKRINCY